MTDEKRDAYLAAIENERAVDRAFLAPEIARFLDGAIPPRPSRYASVIYRHPRIVRMVVRVAAYLAPLLFSMLWMRRFFGLLYACSAAKQREVLPGSVVLGASPRTAMMLRRIPNGDQMSVLSLSWSPLHLTPATSVVPIESLAECRDVFGALADAFRCVSELSLRGCDLALQGYDAMEWFFVFRTLSRDHLRGRLFVINTHDRWAVLADRVSTPMEKVLVQHGFVPGPERVPNRLRSFRRVLVYDADSQQRFIDGVLSDGEDVTFEMIAPSIPLTDLKLGFDSTVLWIGQADGERDRDVVLALSSLDSTLGIIYKPHDVHGGAAIQESGNLRVMREKQVFPLVDLSLTDSSWLGREYEASGIPVLWTTGLRPEEIAQRAEQALKAGRRPQD